MGLFNFLKKNKKEIESEVVQEEQDKPKEKAAKILTKDEVMNIEDENQLLDIIKGNYDWDITSCAVSKLKNQKQLIDYIKSLKSNSDSQRRGSIIDGLTDQEVLGNIISFETDFKFKRNAIKKMTNANIIKKCLVENVYSPTDLDMIEKVTKKEDLLYIFENAPVNTTKVSALINLNDENLFADYIIKENSNNSTLLDYIKDEKKLEKISKEAINNDVKSEAVKKLGGYICVSCGKVNLSKNITCKCKYCGEENHEWEHVENIKDYRDYSSGTRYDICKRCKIKKNEQTIYNM